MHRNNDRKIAEWLGMLNQPHCPKCGTPWREMGDVDYHTVTLCKGQFVWDKIPHYSTADTDAITLLPVLVERGYVNSELSYHNMHWWFKIQKIGYNSPVYYAMKPTIAEAIVGALVKLIESI